MLGKLIAWSINNRLVVVLLACCAVIAGAISLGDTPIDAIPDLSDVQVIVYTEYSGQAPQVVEDQVTYPRPHGLSSHRGRLPGGQAGIVPSTG